MPSFYAVSGPNLAWQTGKNVDRMIWTSSNGRTWGPFDRRRTPTGRQSQGVLKCAMGRWQLRRAMAARWRQRSRTACSVLWPSREHCCSNYTRKKTWRPHLKEFIRWSSEASCRKFRRKQQKAAKNAAKTGKKAKTKVSRSNVPTWGQLSRRVRAL